MERSNVNLYDFAYGLSRCQCLCIQLSPADSDFSQTKRADFLRNRPLLVADSGFEPL